jgi:hypothetical protein
MVVVCLVALWLLLPAEVSAKRVADLDERTGVAFVLDGRTLTATITPGSHSLDVRGELQGKRVVAVCAAGYDLVRRVVREASWPANVDTMSFTFDRDISEKASWCLLEAETGGDIAEASFGPIPGVFFADTTYLNGSKPKGVRRYLRIRDAKGRVVTTRRRLRLPPFLLPPGRYTLISFERHCIRRCRALGPVRLRCARRFRVQARGALAALVRVDPGRERCRITFKSGE